MSIINRTTILAIRSLFSSSLTIVIPSSIIREIRAINARAFVEIRNELMETMSIEGYMKIALEEAAAASDAGEIPVGAVVVHSGKVIARAHNQKELLKDATAHAEMLAMREASRALNDWRLDGCTLYVTLEPCCMCAAAAVSARVKRVVFGAFDPKYGGCGGAFELCNGALGRAVDCIGGILESECARLIDEHFSRARGDAI